ncbi:MAG TPA: Ig-like domain repeat protein [Bacillota bacterium]|nr:Ig-like domain repeat protein [Bacillota bacterium]
MKKNILLVFLSLIVVTIFTVQVSAYSPHYLPGGKNYISSDNIIKVDETISTINPFLVKPYTDYTFSVYRDYFDGRDFLGSIYFYDNEDYLSEINYDNLTMISEGNYLYLTFKTPAEANYLAFEFRDNGTFVSGTELINVQLEEGTVMTAYEPYIQGTIIDTSSPYFIGSGTIISYFDQPITVAEIQNSLTAYDDIDGDLTSRIVIKSDNYSDNMQTLGSYTVVFEVADNSANTTEITINIEVVDVLAPVFSEVGVIQAVYPNVYTPEDIRLMMTASDNYDGDVSTNITLVTDNYSLNANVVGTYTMEFTVTDSSGNSVNRTQEIQVIDNEGPVISGTDNISVGYDQTLTVSAVKAGLSAVDNYDESSELEIILESDNYTENKNTLGNYSMRFSVTDSSGNKTTKTLTVNVIDAVGPIVYLNSSIIQVYADTVLSLSDFAKLLVKTNELDKEQDYFITIRYDSYSNFSTKPGTYHMYLDFMDGYGNTIAKDFQINVIDKSFDFLYIHEDFTDVPLPKLTPLAIISISIGGVMALSSAGIIIYKLQKKKKSI